MKQAILLAVLAGALACERTSNEPEKETAPAATASSPGGEPAPRSERAFLERMNQRLNPEKRAPYAGAVGNVAGRVTITGDAPPPHPRASAIPLGKCFAAHQMYGKLFRVGPEGALADVLVAVTEYDGYLPVKQETVRVTAKDCAFETRTLALRLGQTLMVENLGPGAVTPQLAGLKTSALLLAMPGGDGVPLRPQRPGHYQLVDRSNDFAVADVYTLAYPTTAVTGLDGKFSIDGVPIGEVKVSALLPATGQTLERTIRVQANQSSEVDLQFEFDRAQFEARLEAARSEVDNESSASP